ncbi:MAG TPA: HAD-IIIA family hydrolase [Candidatus Binatia bacterium]
MAAFANPDDRTTDLVTIDAAVLAGGLGTRLRSVVSDRPKVLAQVDGQPFLTRLLDELVAAGLPRVVLCTGYLGDQIQAAIGERYRGLDISYSRETEPLGTAGALKLALPHLNSDPVLVMNGDSFCTVDLKRFVEWHRQRAAAGTLLLTRVATPTRYGLVAIDDNGAVLQFSEKQTGHSPGWINAGVYLLSQRLLSSIPHGRKLSLEYDVFPRWAGRGLYAWRVAERFIDIGTPEDFSRAGDFFRRQQTKFVILDRDGTLIEERSYLSDPAQVALIPGAAAALHKLRQSGYGLVVITNQSGVGRGFFDERRLEEIHRRMQELLAAEGVALDGIYVCPHTPDDGCDCRKPATGLVDRAGCELGFDPHATIVIGDKASDIEMGRLLGAPTFLVRTGYGSEVEADGSAADYVVDDLLAAARTIERLFSTERSEVHGD